MRHAPPIEQQYFLSAMAMRHPERVKLEDVRLVDQRLNIVRRNGPAPIIRKRADSLLRQRGYLPDGPEAA